MAPEELKGALGVLTRKCTVSNNRGIAVDLSDEAQFAGRVEFGAEGQSFLANGIWSISAMGILQQLAALLPLGV